MSGRFTVSGSTLSLLSVGEQGVVTRVTSADQIMLQKLLVMGVKPGVSVTLERRSPRYCIKVGAHQFVIGQETAQSIYVRLTEALPVTSFPQRFSLMQRLTNGLQSLTLKRTPRGQSIPVPVPALASDSVSP